MQTACHVMADVAQDWADLALMQYGATFKAAQVFNGRFSKDYVGAEANILNLNDLRKYGTNDPITGKDRRQINWRYWGESGFKTEYQEMLEFPDRTENDQTHHFATYLGLGINALLPAALVDCLISFLT
jgi:hypothetical protein